MSEDSDPRYSFDSAFIAPANDPRLARATARAQKRLPEFIDLLRERPAGVRFMVKAAFRRTDGRAGLKYMWVRVEAMEDNGVFVGTLDSDPKGATSEVAGDPLRIPAAEVQDWLYDRGGKKHVGGFSTPVLEQIERERRASS
ncbi:MAG: DUF2314 domain-containing protein [Planctomycetota bacterium]